jgi:putative endonuclease
VTAEHGSERPRSLLRAVASHDGHTVSSVGANADNLQVRRKRDGGRRHDPRRALGRLGEEHAAAHLRKLSFAIVGRNVRTRAGEIDIVAFDGHTLVFAEVKTRRARVGRRSAGGDFQPLTLLRRSQRSRLRRLAAAWLRSSGRSLPFAEEIRFDAIGVLLDGRGAVVRLDHLEGAW